jgi:hypothetical protein
VKHSFIALWTSRRGKETKSTAYLDFARKTKTEKD